MAKRPPPSRGRTEEESKARSKIKEQLLKRQKEGEERRELGGRTYIVKGLEGLQFFKCGNGDHLIDIVPFQAGDGHPTTAEGDYNYCLEFGIHKGLGPNGDITVVCPSETFGKDWDCPVCEDKNRKRIDGAEDKVWKALIPRKRTLYNVKVYDSEKLQARGVMVWDVPYFYFQEHLEQLMKGPVRPGSKQPATYIPFADLTEGKSIAFTVDPPKSKDDYPSFKGHRFVEREYEIPMTDVEAARPLDQILNVLSYDQIYDLYWGKESGTSEQERANEQDVPSKEEDFDQTGTEGADDAASGDPEPADEGTKGDGKEEGSTETKSNEKVTECPVGGTFGRDCNQLDKCEDCPEEIWEQCNDESDRLKKAAEERRKAREQRMKG